MDAKLLGSIISALGTVVAALIVGGIGTYITGRHARRRDEQDRESQWRAHAIELSKLDLERKSKSIKAGEQARLRPSILDFLANYRDLKELGTRTPAELYEKIKAHRIEESQDHSA